MAKNETAHSLINVATLATNILSTQHEGSLIEYTGVLRNEPIVTIEDKVAHQSVSTDITKFLTNLFAGYYLQAVAITNNIGNVNVMQVLDRLNTKRDVLYNAKAEFISRESYQVRPQVILKPKISTESLKLMYPTFKTATLESYQAVSQEANFSLLNDKKAADNSNHSTSATARDSIKQMMDAPNLATGKLFEVVIENEGKRATIPVAVRMNPISVSPNLVIELLSLGDVRNTMMERYHRWREGELEFINDLIFCNDLIEKEYALLKADKHGIYKDILQRRRRNKISALITQTTSLATASSIVVLSAETAKEVEMAVGGRLDNLKVRTEVFSQCSLMFMVIVDTEMQMIRIYHRGIAQPMDLTYNEITQQAKGQGPDVMEILKAFSAGNRPNI